MKGPEMRQEVSIKIKQEAQDKEQQEKQKITQLSSQGMTLGAFWI